MSGRDNKVRDLIESVPLVRPPRELDPIVLTCEQCRLEFVHTPRQAQIGQRVYTIPPIPPTLCVRCTEAVREQEQIDELRMLAGVRVAVANDVVPWLYREASLSDLGVDRSEYLKTWLAGTRSLYLYGIAGAGKTHAAAAIVRHAIIEARHGSVVWWNVPELLEELRRSYDDPTRAARIASDIESADLLVLDNIGQEKPSEWVREKLYVLVNRRYERGERVIATSELSLDELAAKVGRAIARRLADMSDQVHLRDIYDGERS